MTIHVAEVGEAPRPVVKKARKPKPEDPAAEQADVPEVEKEEPVEPAEPVVDDSKERKRIEKAAKAEKARIKREEKKLQQESSEREREKREKAEKRRRDRELAKSINPTEWLTPDFIKNSIKEALPAASNPNYAISVPEHVATINAFPVNPSVLDSLPEFNPVFKKKKKRVTFE